MSRLKLNKIKMPAVLNTGLVLLFDQHQHGILDHYQRLVANCLLRG
jgi:hypothetical protein